MKRESHCNMGLHTEFSEVTFHLKIFLYSLLPQFQNFAFEPPKTVTLCCAMAIPLKKDIILCH